MAAPILHHNKRCLVSILSRKCDSNARCLSILTKSLAKAEAASKRRLTAENVSRNSGSVSGSINIPHKILRSRTAILEALSKTVKNDMNKPMYQSVDDPALLSRSDGLLKNHLAAYDNGREAAKAMIAMNPECYTQFWNEPLPQSFDTVLTGYKHEGPSEEALLERIHKRKVTEAVDIYKAIKLQDGETSHSTLEELIDLLAVFNHADPEEISDLSFFITPFFDRDSPFPVSTWLKGNLAEDIFLSLPEKSARAYCSLICGMAENYDKEKAMIFFKEVKGAKLTVDVFTYNKLLSIISLDMESMDDIIQEIEYLLKDMAASNVRPNIGTFNAVLKNCKRISRWRGAKRYALSILSEMQACGIEPSLGTWVEIMNIFYYHKEKSVRTPELFQNMLEVMKDKSYECQESRDVQFFRTAMRVVSTLLTDSKLALQLHQILKNHRNFDLLGHRQSRFAYFKELFLILLPVEHTDDVMALYNEVVPYIFMPPMDVFKALFENIETFDTYHYLPQLCSDIDQSHIYTEKGAIFVYQLLAKKKQEPKLQQQFCDIASAFIQRWEESHLNRIRPYLDGRIIGDIMLIYLNGDQVEKAQSTLQLYRSHRLLQITDPSDESLQALGETLINSDDFTSTKDLLTLMHSIGCENTSHLVTKTLEKFELSEQESNYLKGLSSHSYAEDTSDSD